MKSSNPFQAIAVIIAAFILPAAPALAAPGDLDATFGTNGRQITILDPRGGQGQSVAIQSDGKIVVAGSASPAINPTFALVRYLPDGTLDSSFGDGGMVTSEVSYRGGSGRGLAFLKDGKILVVGTGFTGWGFGFGAARYHTNGTVDTTFGTGGLAITTFGDGPDHAYDVAVQDDGKLVVAGVCRTNGYERMAIVRYQADGTLDASFGDGGKVLPFIGGQSDEGHSVVIQNDGKIVVGGAAGNADFLHFFAMVRLLANGTPDGSFGVGGKVTTQMGDPIENQGYSLALQSDGRILLAGFTWVNAHDFGVARYLPDGTLDASFGAGGKVVTDFGGNSDDMGLHAVLQSDGKIVMAGSSNQGGTNGFAVARYQPDGTLDATFGAGGKVVTTFDTPPPYGASGSRVALQSDGKLVVVGSAHDGTNVNLAVARYLGTTGPEIAAEQPAGVNLTDGSASIDFGSITTGGGMSARTFTVRNPSTAALTGLAVSRDGANGEDFSVSKLGASMLGPGGSTTFTVTFAPTSPGLRQAAIHIASSDADENPFDITISGTGVGVAVPGALDTTFSSGGKVTTTVAGPNSRANGMALQNDGKILLAGSIFNGGNYDFALLRYDADGNLETSFGNQGIVATAIGGSQDYGQSVAVQGDGGIVVAGASNNGTNSDIAVVRYQADGALDPNFGNGGKVITAISAASGEIGRSVALQTDGKILVAGYTDGGTVNQDFVLVRYLADGSLDASFGNGGKAITPVGNGSAYGHAVAVQNGGKILVAGYALGGSGNDDFALVRYLADGTLDPSFGTGGRVITPMGANDDRGQSVAVQSDGKILVGGFVSKGSSFDYDLALARYLADGSLDSTFGNGGKVITDIGEGSDDSGYSLLALPDGSILLAGTSNSGGDYDFALLMYRADGTLDATFGRGGKMIMPVGDSDDFGRSAAVQRDGSIVVAGDFRHDADYDFALVRCIGSPKYAPKPPQITTANPLPSGMVGASYNFTLQATGGAAPYLWTVSSGNLPKGLSLGSDGVIAGTPTTTTNATFTVRVSGRDALDFTNTFTLAIIPALHAGDPDPTFGTGGKVTTALGTNDEFGYSAVVQPDGRIVVAGYSMVGNYEKFALVRYTAEGALDPSFGSGGKVITAMSPYRDYGRSVTLQSDGKIVVAGEAPLSGGTSIALARYLPDGTLDPAFGNGGRVTNSVGLISFARAVRIQPDNKIVVAAELATHCADFGVVRYLSDGSFDPTFGSGGMVTTDFGANSCDYPQGATLQTDGKILVAGYVPGSNGYDFGLSRYLGDGSLDPAFGSGGKAAIPVGAGGDQARGVVVQSDGKIVVTGEASGDFALARHLADGSLDSTFGSGGKVITAITQFEAYPRSLVVQGDGKIVVAGYGGNGVNYDFALARYNTNGTLDDSFGSIGKLLTAIGSGHDRARSVVLQQDGKIVAAGESYNGTNYDFAVVRYIGRLQPEIAVEQPAGTSLADGGSSINFGYTALGGTTTVRTITVRNVGTAVLSGLALALDGAEAGDFSVQTLPTTSLAPGAWISINVSFCPAAAGSRTAAIHITSNDEDEISFDITLIGNGGSLTALQTWRLAHFGSAENSGDAADANDFDQDGVANLIEYSFGGDPRVPDAAALRPQPFLAANKFGLSFRCSSRCAEITYTVQAAASLEAGTWTDIARSFGGGMVTPVGSLSEVSDVGAGLRIVTVTPVAGLFPAGQGFLRILISE